MIRFFVYLIVGFFALFVETAWLTSWPSQTLRLELIWVLVLFLGFTVDFRESAVLILALGFIEDILGTPFLGFFTTIYFVVVALLRTFIAHIFVETLWARLLWVGIFTQLATLMEWGLLELMGFSYGIRAFLITYGLLQSLVNMVIAAFLMPLLDRFEGSLLGQSRGV